MNPEEQQNRSELEQQIKNDFSELQKKLEELKNELKSESDLTKKQEKSNEIQKMESDLLEMKNLIDRLSALQLEDLQSLKIRLEEYAQLKQDTQGELTGLGNELKESQETNNIIKETPTTYELLEGTETYTNIENIINNNQEKFINIPGGTAQEKIKYIFDTIRNSTKEFLENRLGKSEKAEKIINNVIEPALEWNLLELLSEGSDTNEEMLTGMDNISFESFSKLFKGVKRFSKANGSSSQMIAWMNAIDYLSVQESKISILNYAGNSEILSNPVMFKKYLNNDKFAEDSFSPYEATTLADVYALFGIDQDKSFEIGISNNEIEEIKDQIGNIKVESADNVATVGKLVGKAKDFLEKSPGLQDTANHLLDGLDNINRVTKKFGVDILGEISKSPQERGFLYKILDFVCKLVGITGGLEGIVKNWRLNRLNLGDKTKNIKQIIESYHNGAGKGVEVSIVDQNSCKTMMDNFKLTDPTKSATSMGDYLRDAMVREMDVFALSPSTVQQTLGDSYLKEEKVEENGKTKKKKIVNIEKFTPNDKLLLAQKHIENMKSNLEGYDHLKDFYTHIHNTDDIAICMTASLYADKDDVIEGVKAEVFLPESYGGIRSDGTVENGGTGGGDEQEERSGEVSQYKLSPGEYPFKDVPPYKGIATYDLRKVKMTPVLDYSELVKKHEGIVTLMGSNITNKGYEYPANSTTGNKNNNPCDISHSSFDIGYVSSSTVADGQRLAKYNRPVDGIASAMRLLKNKYQNKSVTEIDVGGYQGYYKPDEEIGLSALRLKWITDQCNALGIGPHQMLDFNDPTTLKSFVAQVAVLETGTKIGQKLLDDAYNLAFS